MKRWWLLNGALALACLGAGFLALNLGPAPVSLFSSAAPPAATHAILWATRLPRILLALTVGAALGSAGSAYQTLLGNPLADPYILGVSGGAALGSALAVACRLPFPGVVAIAFGMSLCVLLAIHRIAARPGRPYAHILLLTGVIVNAFAFAGILFLQAILPMERTHEILFLLMGNLAFSEGPILAVVAAAVVVGIVLLITRAPALNALVLGEETAAALGVDLRRLQREIFFAGSLMVGAGVAVSGLIGFVGLFVPHAMRLFGLTDHRFLIPASAFGGAFFLLAADTVARTAFAGATHQTELPVGVITALVGAPCFLYLLRRQL